MNQQNRPARLTQYSEIGTHGIPARRGLETRRPTVGIAAIDDIVQDLWIGVERWVYEADL